MSESVEAGKVEPIAEEGVRGFLHRPIKPNGQGLLLTHGAGSDCNAPLLTAVAKAFAIEGIVVLRCDLDFRRKRPKGPPLPGGAESDRESLRHALALLKNRAPGPSFLAGHSYGGRQASMLAADEPDIAAALLLLSYPLHPPDKPERMRTAHFKKLRTRSLFVSGVADPFGSVSELQEAIKLIDASTSLILIERAGHDLKRGRFNIEPLVRALVGQRLK
jgi:uncharacterized protein